MKVKAFCFLIIFFCFQSLHAQFLLEYNGMPYNYSKTENVQGDPFLFNNWKIGKVILTNGDEFDNVKLKFDAEQNKFLYNHNDSLYQFTQQVSKIILYDDLHAGDTTFNMVFTTQIDGIDDVKLGSFIQILSLGKITLLKYYQKKIEGENKSDGYSASVRQYKLYTNFWLLANTKIMPAKIATGFFDEITSDKRSLLKEYISANKLNVKNERDFIIAIKYYNRINR